MQGGSILWLPRQIRVMFVHPYIVDREGLSKLQQGREDSCIAVTSCGACGRARGR